MRPVQERVPIEEVFAQLQCTRAGLSEAKAEELLKAYGYNKLEERKVRRSTQAQAAPPDACLPACLACLPALVACLPALLGPEDCGSDCVLLPDWSVPVVPADWLVRWSVRSGAACRRANRKEEPSPAHCVRACVFPWCVMSRITLPVSDACLLTHWSVCLDW